MSMDLITKMRMKPVSKYELITSSGVAMKDLHGGRIPLSEQIELYLSADKLNMA